MTCQACTKWVLKRRRLYSDGAEKVYFQVLGGKGLCEDLKIETDPSFSCANFVGDPSFDHVHTDVIQGSPWEHWKMGKCPDCTGRGCGEEGGACRRCVGTGHVRFYDDGYVGEERTRRHPKEPELTIVSDPGTVLAPVEKPNVL